MLGGTIGTSAFYLAVLPSMGVAAIVLLFAARVLATLAEQRAELSRLAQRQEGAGVHTLYGASESEGAGGAEVFVCRERGHDDNPGTTASPVRSVQRGLQLLHFRRAVASAAARPVPVRTLLRTGKGKQTGWQQLQNVRRRPPAPHAIFTNC